ncbi:MAG: DUF799 family lipoprotein [Bacteroidales bacterium]|nr:DUF799 family lipoprotein [Bacteroidales bacterium]
MKKVLLFIAAAVVLSGCGLLTQTTGGQFTRVSQYPMMYEEKPLTLLVMPPINNSSNVDAKELLFTSISKPLVEAGYYVISPRLAMDILKAESAYDSELFYEGSLTPFKTVFGADAVVFSVIDTWAKKGFGIETKLSYIIRSAHTGEILFDRSCDLYLDLNQTSNSSSGLLGAVLDLATSALSTALTDHIVAARKANYYIFKDIPRGKYNPDFGIDGDRAAEKKDISATVK